MISTHAALVYTMVMVSASDRDMKDVELSTIGHIVKHLPVFKDYEVDRLPATASECAELLSGDNGLDAALDLVVDSLPEGQRETAYALALEVAAADRKVALEEMRILELVRHGLGIDRLVAAAIERGVRARYTTA